jgi:hypothetical protein
MLDVNSFDYPAWERWFERSQVTMCRLRAKPPLIWSTLRAESLSQNNVERVLVAAIGRGDELDWFFICIE